MYSIFLPFLAPNFVVPALSLEIHLIISFVATDIITTTAKICCLLFRWDTHSSIKTDCSVRNFLTSLLKISKINIQTFLEKVSLIKKQIVHLSKTNLIFTFKYLIFTVFWYFLVSFSLLFFYKVCFYQKHVNWFTWKFWPSHRRNEKVNNLKENFVF